MYDCIYQLGVPPRELPSSLAMAITKPQPPQPSSSSSESLSLSISAVDWESLSEEILEHIFARMPIKAAVRASCVCRHWQAIVDSSSFVTFILQFRLPKR